MDKLALVFAGMLLLCLLLAVVSLLTPRLALPFKKKTRLKGLGFWLGLGCVFFALVGMVVPESEKNIADVTDVPLSTEPPVPAARVEQAMERPVMALVPKAFIRNFNKYAEEFGCPTMPDKPTKDQSGAAARVRTYMLNDNMFIQFQTPSDGGETLLGIILAGQGDGSPESGKNLLFAAMGTVAAITPGLSADSRGNILRELGIAPLACMDGKTRNAVIDGVSMQTLYSQQMGLMLTASPTQTGK